MVTKLRILAYCLPIAFSLSVTEVEAQTVPLTITVINGDAGVSTGLNDPNLVPDPTSHGCLTGDTWGQCRMRTLQAAANVWASKLMAVSPSIPIQVNAQMVPMACSGGEAALASAGPTRAAANFPNAPMANVAYSIAEADSLTGIGMAIYATGSEADPYDMTLQFNLGLDTDSSCTTSIGSWWYGDATSLNGILADEDVQYVPLMTIALHELAHGLGFTSMIAVVPPPTDCDPMDCIIPDDLNGDYLTSDNLESAGTKPPIWAYFLADASLGERWVDMSEGQRSTSMSNDPYLVWAGPLTNAQAYTQLAQQPTVYFDVNGADRSLPTGLAATNFYSAEPATFAPSVTTPIDGTLVLMNDGVIDPTIMVPDSCMTLGTGTGPIMICSWVNGSFSDGCEASTTDLTGKVVLIDAGYCSDTVKVANAQAAGARAVLIANNIEPSTSVDDPFTDTLTDMYNAQSVFQNDGADGAYTPTGTIGRGVTAPFGMAPPMAVAVSTIPVYGISKQTRDLMVAYLTGSVPGYPLTPADWIPPTVSLGLFSTSPNEMAGTTAGCVRMYAPSTLEPGSSVSHFHQDIIPHLLMAPDYKAVAIPVPDFTAVDLTPSLLADIGWNTNSTSGVPTPGAYNPCTIH